MPAQLQSIRNLRRASVGTYQPDDGDEEALAVVKERWRPDDPVKRSLEQAWLTNIAFLMGFQYLSWDPIARQLVYAQTPSLRWRARAVHNFIRPYVKQGVATVASFKPRFKCRPINSDPENYQAAEANTKVLDHYWRATNMPRKRFDTLYWKQTTGNAFTYVGWNPNGGERYEDVIRIEREGTEYETVEVEYEGDLESEVVSPFSIYVDANARCIEDVRWLIRAEAVPIEWVEVNFPDKAHFVRTGLRDLDITSRQRYVTDLASQAGLNPSGVGINGDDDENWCVRKQLWELPSRDYPRGRYFIECGGVIMRRGDNPTPKHLIPFVWHRQEIVPGRLWAQCDVDNLLSLQRNYNRLVSKRVEHIVLTANAKILTHATNDLPPSAFVTEIGEIIKWAGATPPGYLVPPPMPPETDTELMRLRQDFDAITLQFGPGRGQYQGRLSGKAIYTLIEQQIQNRTPEVELLADEYAQWGHLVLEWLQEYVKEPRLIKVLGRANQWDVQEFQGQDIKGNTDTTLDIDSMTPKSKMMALEIATSLIQLGLLNPQNPEDRARVWKMLDLEDDAPIIEDKNLDRRRALLENKLMFMGVKVEPPMWFEDLDVHALSHTEAMKTDEYKNAPPHIKAMFEEHMNLTLNIGRPQVGATVTPEMMEMEGAPQPQGGQRGLPSPQSAPQPMPAMTPFT